MIDASYENMPLDEIIQLTESDDRYAPELEEQSAGAARLWDRVSRAMDTIAAAAQRVSGPQWGEIGSALSGHTGNAAFERVRDLSELTGTAHTAMEPQSEVMLKLADRARGTHREVAGLRQERETWLRMVREDPKNPKLREEFGGFRGLLGIDKDPAELERSIREHYDDRARGVMSDAGTGYLEDTERLEPIGSYSGPRIPREEPRTGHRDGEFHHRPGPSVEPRRPEADGQSIASPSPAPDPVPDHDSGPELQTGVGTAPSPGPTAPGPTPVGDVYVPGKPVLPPVIGSRPGPSATPTPNRQPPGLSRPVIGARSTPGMPTGRTGATGIPNSMAGTARSGTGPRTTAPPGQGARPGGPTAGQGPRSGGAAPRGGFRPAPTVSAPRANTAASGIPNSMAKTTRTGTGASPRFGTATGTGSSPRTGGASPRFGNPTGTGSARPGTPAARSGGPVASGPHARPVAGVPESMARTTRTPTPNPGQSRTPAEPGSGIRSGSRARAHEPEGRVIGRRTPTADTSAPVRAVRTARVVHGGNENLNRSVIGNMRSTSPPPRPRAVDDHDDFDDDFDWKEDERR